MQQKSELYHIFLYLCSKACLRHTDPPVLRIYIAAIYRYAKMKMRASGIPSTSYLSNKLSPHYSLSFRHIDFAQMGIGRLYSSSVRNDDTLTEAFAPAGNFYLSCLTCQHIRPRRKGYINAFMILRSDTTRRLSMTKRRGNIALFHILDRKTQLSRPGVHDTV